MDRFFSYFRRLAFKSLIFVIVMGGVFGWTVKTVHETPGLIPAPHVADQDLPRHFISIEDETFARLADSLNEIEPAAAPAFEPLPLPAIVAAEEGDKESAPAEPGKNWEKFAVPFIPAAGKPLIAIVIDDLGMGRKNTKRTSDLPAPITMAFLPYASDLPRQTGYAREKGHELIIHVPMEPEGKDFPGPGALLTSLDEKAILARLEKDFGAFEGYVGINNHMGSKFTSTPEKLSLVMEQLAERGLLFLDSVTSEKSAGSKLARQYGVSHAVRDVFLDHVETPEAVEKSLRQAEAIARQQGYAIAIGHPKDVTLDALEKWLPTLEQKGFQLAPLSAVVRLPDKAPSQALAGK